MIPERARKWTQGHLPSPIVSIRPISGGRTDSVNAVDLADGSRRTLRFLDARAWGLTGERQVAAEALGWQLTSTSSLPVPSLIAVDASSQLAGGYASLSSWLDGRVRLDALTTADLSGLADVAVAIHTTEVPRSHQPPRFAFWAPPEPDVPSWAREQSSWRSALQIFKNGPPDSVSGLVHGDFHAGNVLWDGGHISGVIDWTETSWGPAELDVMHARTNLAILQCPEHADLFVDAYQRSGGRLDPDPTARRFWAVADIFGFLPDPVPVLNRLVRGRPDLEPDAIRSRLERLLVDTLSTAS